MKKILLFAAVSLFAGQGWATAGYNVDVDVHHFNQGYYLSGKIIQTMEGSKPNTCPLSIGIIEGDSAVYSGCFGIHVLLDIEQDQYTLQFVEIHRNIPGTVIEDEDKSYSVETRDFHMNSGMPDEYGSGSPPKQ